jgi:peptidoglycan hydrolase CwlO-like protein
VTAKAGFGRYSTVWRVTATDAHDTQPSAMKVYRADVDWWKEEVAALKRQLAEAKAWQAQMQAWAAAQQAAPAAEATAERAAFEPSPQGL